MPVDFSRLRRVLRKPPHVIFHRMLSELDARTDRFRAPRRAASYDISPVLAHVGAHDVDRLWTSLSDRPYAIPLRRLTLDEYDRTCPGDSQRIVRMAEQALARRVDLLGSGPIDLGSPIDWQRDFKTGKTWPLKFIRDLDYVSLQCPSDVKTPWEISRLQWLIPAGQAFMLTGDERYAEAVRQVIDEWIDGNPYAFSVNWACTMEAAMRIITWTWFFHVFCRSEAWSGARFRARFLRTLFLHGEFTERYLERASINGNHFTADAAALVFAGLFFGRGTMPLRWADAGWRMLCDELPRQVHPDGVDFEASVPYHRLVMELFFMAARYREAVGREVPDEYRDRLVAMARFTQAYSRPDGSSPLVGDGDDARVLPFGGQPIGDHRYLAGLVGAHWCVPDLMQRFAGPREEVLWTLGRRAAMSLPEATSGAADSAAFPHGGFYVMRNAQDHVFIDCGPIGTAGLGGHGHNDCLSFEAVLDGVHVVSDCGAYVYTASALERNRFRSTAYHNTPQIDGEESNRFTRWDQLWTLHDDAAPDVLQWSPGSDRDVFVGTHTGYHRLGPISPIRTIWLDHQRHALEVTDHIQGTGHHVVSIPLHLASGVEARIDGPGRILLTAGAKRFLIEWSSARPWEVQIGPGRIAPSYGVIVPAVRLLWRYEGQLPVTLSMRALKDTGAFAHGVDAKTADALEVPA
jgi:uncharacterized heparinase superfamily protein